jgi:ATP-dependent helicase/nuclease subunit B
VNNLPHTRRFPESELLRGAAEAIIAAEQARLPDLSACTVLVPNLHAAPALARALGQAAGVATLLLPTLTTLPQLAKQAALTQASVPDSVRQSLLYEALRARKWFDATLLWPLTGELLKLFDELTLNQVRLPDSYEDFVRQLAQAYAASAGASLQFEARLVHELWHALRHDLGARLDPASAYVLQLGQLAQTPGAPLYGVGLADLAPVEHDFLARYAERQPVLLFAADTLTAADCSASGALLQAAWNHQGSGIRDQESLASSSLFERAAQLRAYIPASPLAHKFKLFGAQSLEEEARAAALQVRLWLAQGKHDIAIVAQDRLTARRVRALLERDQVLVRDETGWTFSTTAASALIMRWLDLVADDFYYQDLLDFLKSPLVLSHIERETRRDAVSALELLIREHNVVARLAHYLDLARANDQAACVTLLEALDAARAGWHTRRAMPLAAWLKRLTDTLSQLGILVPLARDLAGGQMLDMLARAATELETATETFRFAEWRHWLNQRFESATFLDTGIDSPIVFTHLPATRLRTFDAALLLGCDSAHLPAPPPASVFFNQAVRASLQLPTWRDAMQTEQGDVAGLLARAPETLATWQAFQQGKPNLLSPLFELLGTCHAQAYGTNLFDTRLRALLAAQTPTVPNSAHDYPAPHLDAPAIPKEISASGYASLMACPYQYFARHVLRLNQLEDVQLALEKRDFGTLAHRILHAFHRRHPLLSADDPAQLDASLREVSLHIFAPLLRMNYLSRAWLTQWEKLIPVYLEWQLAREAQGWHWHAGEQSERITYALAHGEQITLKGRLDRLDTSREGRAVIDYKMKAKDALRKQLKLPGEDVQLPVYALLAGELATEAAYLSFDHDQVHAVKPEGDIQELAQQVAGRLQTVFEALYAGADLPAHGAEPVCAQCEMEGLCRRSYRMSRNANG